MRFRLKECTLKADDRDLSLLEIVSEEYEYFFIMNIVLVLYKPNPPNCYERCSINFAMVLLA